MSHSKNRDFFLDLTKTALLPIIKASFEENLLSVMLYGSILSDNFIPGVSDINILIIINKGNAEQILLFGVKAHRLLRKHKITPLILTRSEFINSADVFPMEYHDIQDTNKVLYGADETLALTLTKKNLRHQLEERLRGQVTHSRQLLIAAKGNKRVIRRFLTTWGGSFSSVFRGLLRLKQIANNTLTSEELIKKTGEVFQIDTKPFLQLLGMRKNQEKIDPHTLISNLHEELIKLIQIVDQLDFKEK